MEAEKAEAKRQQAESQARLEKVQRRQAEEAENNRRELQRIMQSNSKTMKEERERREAAYAAQQRESAKAIKSLEDTMKKQQAAAEARMEEANRRHQEEQNKKKGGCFSTNSVTLLLQSDEKMESFELKSPHNFVLTPLYKLERGNIVLSIDPTGKFIPTKVVAIHPHENSDAIDFLRFTLKNGKISTMTGSHVHLKWNDGSCSPVQAKTLKVNDILKTVDGYSPIVRVLDIRN